MHILIDIGNSTIVIAMADSGCEINSAWRFKTLKDETVSFFRYELKAGIKKYGIQISDIETITISSVVPEVNDYIAQAIIDITGITPHFFNLNDALRTIDIDIESPSQLGKDRLADAVGAVLCHGVPAIVIDMGTATTVGVIDENKCFKGGMIIPGVKTSLKALSTKASQLPMVSIEKPEHIIGRNTLECMQSGILYGNAAMVDGIIDRIRPTLHGDVKVIATGGMARQIIPFCRNEIVIDNTLQLKGVLLATRR
ncbi:MAG: type III pantothenate kinase [Prevotella sp.]|jgi:type III pantothenate kinase|nr:type III pantothenate kinase [Prevotella sp.]MBQ6760402.1 type III pantothenate kinase [Prevotella sp.]MBQ7452159.1 type III pantothenate kinase [Prevotella sp.]MBQ8058521.1 type III pantothenate kinase [Prevotella sp.]MBQ8116045.1 type III pantothenate kinase [Prevotella sp.]